MLKLYHKTFKAVSSTNNVFFRHEHAWLTQVFVYHRLWGREDTQVINEIINHIQTFNLAT